MKILLILVGINAWCGQQNVVILVQCVYVSYRSVLNCERFTYRQVFVFNIHSNAVEAFCLRHGRCDAQCDATTRIVAHTIDRIPNCMDSNHMSIGLRYAYTFDSALWTCCSLHKYMQVWDCDIFGGNWRMGQTLYICMQADSAMQNLIYARHRIKYYSYAFNRISCRDSFIFIWLIFYSLIQTVFFQWNRVFKQWHEIHRNSFIVWVLKWIVNGVTYRIVIVY